MTTAELKKTTQAYAKLQDAVSLPIRNKSQYRAALKLSRSLALKERNALEQGLYEVLATFIGVYENTHFEIGKNVSGLEVLRFLVDENGMSASDLGRILGNRTLGPAILRGERGLSKANIRTLTDHFKVSAELFLRE